jgi:hypothetical protein
MGAHLTLADAKLAMVTTGDRPEMLWRALNSVFLRYPELHLVLVGQAVPGDVQHAAKRLVESRPGWNVSFVWTPRLAGSHVARVTAIDHFPDAPLWINLDDDMMLIPATDYAPMIAKAQEPGVGFVNCRHCRYEAQVAATLPRLSPAFRQVPLAWTNGGLAYTREVGRIVAALPRKHYICDNTEWSLALYTRGYQNWAYDGSLAVHTFAAKGGRRRTMKVVAMDVPDSAMVNTFISALRGRPGDRKTMHTTILQNNIETDIENPFTDLAHRLHAEARPARLQSIQGDLS